MALSAFDDNANQPREEELMEVLGRSGARWCELIERIGAEFDPVTQEWGFSGAKWGWWLRLKRKKRAIVYLTPCERHFLAGIVLGEKAVKAAREAKLPKEVMKVIDDAPKYAEGRGVRLEVRTKKDVADVVKIATIKMAN